MLHFIKAHYQNFSIRHYYTELDARTRDVAERSFRQIINAILMNKKAKKPLKLWAKAIHDGKFSVLKSSEAELYWKDVENDDLIKEAAAQQRRRTIQAYKLRLDVGDEILEKAGEKRSNEDVCKRQSKRLKENRPMKNYDEFQVEEEEQEEDEDLSPMTKLFWLSGVGQARERIDHERADAQWIIRDCNITRILYKYHNDLVKLCQVSDLQEVSDMMSINYIFYFPLSTKKGAWTVIANEFHAAIRANLDLSDGAFDVSQSAKNVCDQLSKVAKHNPEEVENIMLEYRVTSNKSQDPVQQAFSRCLDDLSTNFRDVYGEEAMEEAQFAERAVMPYLKRLFTPDQNYAIIGPTKSSKAAKAAYSKVDTSLIAPKPDVLITRDDIECIAGEVKKPHTRKIAVETDLLKLGNVMKLMLDESVEVKAGECAAVAGIHVHGFSCSTYKMDLLYDGVYRLIELGDFNLMRNGCDFQSALNSYEHFLQIKNITATTKACLAQRNWRRPSFLPPKKYI